MSRPISSARHLARHDASSRRPPATRRRRPHPPAGAACRRPCRSRSAGQVELVALAQALADRPALGGPERVRHRPADQDVVHSLQQVLDHADLVADLRPAEDRHERPLRRLQRLAEVLQLLLDQEAEHAVARAAAACGTSYMLTCLRWHVPNASLTYISPCAARPLANSCRMASCSRRQLLVRVLLGLVDDRPRPCGSGRSPAAATSPSSSLRDGLGDRRADAGRHELDRLAQQLAHALGHRLRASTWRPAAGSPVGRPRWLITIARPPLLTHVLERGQEHADAAVVGHVLLLVERHVEVGADEDASAPHFQVANGFLRHRITCLLQNAAHPTRTGRER